MVELPRFNARHVEQIANNRERPGSRGEWESMRSHPVLRLLPKLKEDVEHNEGYREQKLGNAVESHYGLLSSVQ